ncbi:discoidin domain-containing protein [Lysobacter sp. Root604]|uniref:discoidin domain-containing protein n=1 Tax=Lysobacter sp. Root604 TaxID=1736568 RepID=UPI00070060F0|nr:discoidin domain-containing protein [Lysobacter sp. Root604]KRA21390.1 coagulation factor 5/8 type domain-containing protein [Lysobacter sp. Root604]
MCFALLLLTSLPASAKPRTLDTFESTAPWTVVTSNQVSGQLRLADGAQGKAICLDYDFNDVSGYVGLQRALPMQYPDNYAFSFQLRGDSPVNDLQFKLVDDSGDNVWWVNRPKYAFPKQWTPVVYKQRHISRAWGPAPDPTLRRSAKLEFTIYNSSGGKGSVCFDQLTFEPLPKEDGAPLTGRVVATTAAQGSRAEFAVDGDPKTAWHAGFATDPDPALTLDLGRKREFGGVVLRWADDEYASDYRLQLSDDGKQWQPAIGVRGGNGGTDHLPLPEAEARYLRLLPENGAGLGFGLAEFSVQPLAFAATPNDFVAAIAKEAPRGRYPRGFSGEQPYWTIVGVDGGEDQGLIGEDGAIEVGKGGFSIEPFVVSGDRLVTWADVQTSQSLQDGYLPIPSVKWAHPEFALDITAFAQGVREDSTLYARYRLTNTGASPRRYVFVLAARPLQVNPPSQFLNTVGGVSPIYTISASEGIFTVAGRERVRASKSAAAFASAYDQGDVVERLANADWSSFCKQACADNERPFTLVGSSAAEVSDASGLASGALLYAVELAPGASQDFSWDSRLSGAAPPGPPPPPRSPQQVQDDVARQWRDKLDRVRIAVPKQGQPIVDTLRTGLAHMLISRVGPRLQPGTRSYSRAWIRDGAMIGEGLLRMGREDVAEEFLRWYAPYQFDNGKVPCCVDDRGSDPVPENDSHGELIFTVAEVYRYRRDRALLDAMWPHVLGAVKYMDELRLSERTEANRAKNPAFYGMMPASISHEGYSAKPMHSYWDNFWALRGYKDAVEIAQWLGKDDEARRIKASRDQFRDDLYASIAAATRDRGIDFIPGAAELGDFDATSTTIALAPGGEQGRLPETLLRNTFERYWMEFVDRRDGRREWKDYTPYELRTIGSFVRLGWRERAHQALDFFFKDQQPRGWNQWAEVVSRTPRKPFFVGDLPHAWVESDYVRSALDLFAYTRDLDEALVIGAGLPADWLDDEGVSVTALRTPYGQLSYRLRSQRKQLQLSLEAGLTPPAGGVVLSWPYPQAPGATRIDGQPAQWRNGELRIERVPAKVTVELAQ